MICDNCFTEKYIGIGNPYDYCDCPDFHSKNKPIKKDYVKKFGPNVVICNICDKQSDTAVIGVLKCDGNKIRVAFCGNCVNHMKNQSDGKNKIPKVEEYDSEVWQSATDES